MLSDIPEDAVKNLRTGATTVMHLLKLITVALVKNRTCFERPIPNRVKLLKKIVFFIFNIPKPIIKKNHFPLSSSIKPIFNCFFSFDTIPSNYISNTVKHWFTTRINDGHFSTSGRFLSTTVCLQGPEILVMKTTS